MQNNSRKVSEKFFKKLNERKPFVVVPGKGREPRFYDPDRYFKHKMTMRDVILNYKPWTKRKKSILGPIGTKSLEVQEDLTRSEIYEER